MHSKEQRTVHHPPDLVPEDLLRFVQVEPFPRQWKALGLGDDDLRALEVLLMAMPGRSPVIPEGGGLRKFRFAKEAEARGKSGSYRVFYAYYVEYSIILLLAVLDKGDKADLSRGDLHEIAKYLKRIQVQLDNGKIK